MYSLLKIKTFLFAFRGGVNTWHLRCLAIFISLLRLLQEEREHCGSDSDTRPFPPRENHVIPHSSLCSTLFFYLNDVLFA